MVTNLKLRFAVRIPYLLACISLLLLPGCGDSDVAPTTASPDPTSVNVSSEARPAGEGDVSVAEPDGSRSVVDQTNTPSVDPATADSSTETPLESVAAAPASNISENSPEPAETTVETTPTEANASSTPPAKAGPDAAAKLEQQLAAFTIPPEWLVSVRPKWSTAKPWKEGRKEIRRLLGTGDETDRREGIRLTWDYLQKDEIGDGHEYGMYMFLGNEPLWAVHVYREWLARTDHSYPPYFGIKALASLYAGYGLSKPRKQYSMTE